MRTKRKTGWSKFSKPIFCPLQADTKVTLDSAQSGAGQVSVLRLKNAPFTFQLTGKSQSMVEDVVLRTDRGRGGFVRVTIHYLDSQQTRNYKGRVSSDLGNAHFVVLADRLRKFEWRLFDPARQRWESEWKREVARPSMAELTISHEGDTAEKKITCSGYLHEAHSFEIHGNRKLPAVFRFGVNRGLLGDRNHQHRGIHHSAVPVV